MMIAATAPLFTILYARVFLKESVSVMDLMNLVLVFAGVVFIVKPPFLFGSSERYNEDSTTLYAMIGLLVGSLLLMAPIYVILRKLKGKFSNISFSVYHISFHHKFAFLGIHWSVVNTYFGSKL